MAGPGRLKNNANLPARDARKALHDYSSQVSSLWCDFANRPAATSRARGLLGRRLTLYSRWDCIYYLLYKLSTIQTRRERAGISAQTTAERKPLDTCSYRKQTMFREEARNAWPCSHAAKFTARKNSDVRAHVRALYDSQNSISRHDTLMATVVVQSS
jgi:hypothetical protein